MITYILCGVIVLQYIIHYVERRDLYNRLMSRDLNDYKGKPIQRAMSAHEAVLKRWREGEKE